MHIRRATELFSPVRLAPLTLSLLLGACASLPPELRPRILANDGVYDPDAFLYRTLTRNDFAAPKPLDEVADHAARIGAYTCTTLRPLLVGRAREISSSDPARKFHFHVRALAFEARFSPQCSWWNPQNQAGTVGYLLQHEQVHFALWELANRDLNRKAIDIANQLSLVGASAASVTEAARTHLSNVVRDKFDETQKIQLEFDLETSRVRNPQRQAVWMEEVSHDLTRPYAVAGDVNPRTVRLALDCAISLPDQRPQPQAYRERLAKVRPAALKRCAAATARLATDFAHGRLATCANKVLSNSAMKARTMQLALAIGTLRVSGWQKMPVAMYERRAVESFICET